LLNPLLNPAGDRAGEVVIGIHAGRCDRSAERRRSGTAPAGHGRV